MDLTEAVTVAMERLNMKRSDIARATGYSHQHISDLLAGERRWNEESIRRVCEALDIQVSYNIKTS